MISLTSPDASNAPSWTSVVSTNTAAAFDNASCPADVSVEAAFLAKQKANSTRSLLGRR